MLRTVDEYALRHTPETPGVYVFHLSAIRPSTVGLDNFSSMNKHKLAQVKNNCLLILRRILDLQSSSYQGSLREVDTYMAHGTTLSVEGHLSFASYLHDTVKAIEPSQLTAFVQAAELIATVLPPVYVGITEQSVQSRYKQHKTNHSNRTDGTFGGRLAEAGFQWSDIVFSFAAAPTLRLENRTLLALETYIQVLSRPKLGRA